MDSQVAYQFHSERQAHPEKFKNQFTNQVNDHLLVRSCLLKFLDPCPCIVASLLNDSCMPLFRFGTVVKLVDFLIFLLFRSFHCRLSMRRSRVCKAGFVHLVFIRNPSTHCDIMSSHCFVSESSSCFKLFREQGH